VNEQQAAKMGHGRGFVAALDQSGGSTPKALKEYGIAENRYGSDAEMFDLVHAMRTRIITSREFTGGRILGSILFEQTMDREIDGLGAAEYLWQAKEIVPFLKVDKGLAEQQDGAQPMKPIGGLDELLDRARKHPIFGTKMRSVIHLADQAGIDAVLDQQFSYAKTILAAGLVPIIEPEVDITSLQKAAAETLLLAGILQRLETVPDGQQVMCKLSLPTEAGLYADLTKNSRVLRVVALSGGYERDEACQLLSKNPGVIASFSRALTQGLSAAQSDKEFDQTLDTSIAEIYQASVG
jgi:fructose-bisphosphate aldolase class I